MKDWLRGKPSGFIGFLVIAGSRGGRTGLGHGGGPATGERTAHSASRGRTRQSVRVALWRLDSRISPLLAREDSRPFNHYSAVYPLPLALNNKGMCCSPGTVLEPSPLLSAELPPWMLLHFQTDRASGWNRRRCCRRSLRACCDAIRAKLPLANVTPERRRQLTELTRELPVADLLQQAGEHSQPATVHDTTLLLARNNLDNLDHAASNPHSAKQRPANNQMAQGANPTATRRRPRNTIPAAISRTSCSTRARRRSASQKDLALNTVPANGANWFVPRTLAPAGGRGAGEPQSDGSGLAGDAGGRGTTCAAAPGSHRGYGNLSGHRAWTARRCRGMLAQEVTDLFPEARLMPMREPVPSQPERTMTALPFQLDPGPALFEVPDPGWTPLRVGLALAWLAALVALLAVGLGGWSLLNLSERRIRFVSAVTHELRTPLTTLRLYLDMLVNGLVREDKQRGEYIHTLHAETERLNRLVGNVLDFSRLENQRPRSNRTRVVVADLLEQVRATWAGRCLDAEKELILENSLAADAALWTDRELVPQVLGNLIDNACKYSCGAEDRRLWVRRGAMAGVWCSRSRTGDRACRRRIGERFPRFPARPRRG